MGVRCASETAPVDTGASRNIGALRLHELSSFRSRRGNVRYAFERGASPLTAVKVFLTLRLVIVVGDVIPLPERGVIIARARHEVIIGVNGAGADRRFGRVARATAGHETAGQAANQNQPDAFAPFHCWKDRGASAKHGRRDNDANAQNHRARDNGRPDANGGKEQHKSNGFGQRLRVPARGGRGICRPCRHGHNQSDWQ